jgi:hypothetical protein
MDATTTSAPPATTVGLCDGCPSEKPQILTPVTFTRASGYSSETLRLCPGCLEMERLIASNGAQARAQYLTKVYLMSNARRIERAAAAAR